MLHCWLISQASPVRWLANGVWTRFRMDALSKIRFLNLGAGVQSTAVFLMMREGLIDMCDYAGFADTQEEPEEVYQHLKWIKTLSAPVPIILEGTAGRIGDDLLRGENTTKQRFASIPAYTAPGEPNAVFVHALETCRRERKDKSRKIGKLRRQCTKEYKTSVIEKIIRREVLGLKPRQRIPKGTHIEQVFGISYDEQRRAVRIRARFESVPWATPTFPLIDMQLTREDCKRWLKSRVPHEVPRLACVFCPFKSTEEWLHTKRNPKAWARAVEVDEGLRKPGAIAQRGLDQPLYVHRSAIPLAMVDFDAELVKEQKRKESKRTPLLELLECGEGVCGL